LNADIAERNVSFRPEKASAPVELTSHVLAGNLIMVVAVVVAAGAWEFVAHYPFFRVLNNFFRACAYLPCFFCASAIAKTAFFALYGDGGRNWSAVKPALSRVAFENSGVGVQRATLVVISNPRRDLWTL
jgi:hypothetical protein